MVSGVSAPPPIGARESLATIQSDIAMLKSDITQKKKEIEAAHSGQQKMKLKAELEEMQRKLLALEAKRQAMADSEAKKKDVDSTSSSKIGTRNFDASTPFGSRVMWA